MSYQLIISKGIKKVIESLPEAVERRVIAHIEALETNPRPTGVKELKGKDGWRIRIGDYRVVYRILDEEEVILLAKIGYRKDVYQ